jgi:hypothetical protein
VNTAPKLSVAAVETAEPAALERHYTVDQLVEAGICPTRATGWAWARQGRIRHIRISGGRGILFPASAVREFLARHVVEASR